MNKEAKTMSKSAEIPALSDSPGIGVILQIIGGLSGILLVVVGFYFFLFP
jgi:hypothetical protein